MGRAGSNSVELIGDAELARDAQRWLPRAASLSATAAGRSPRNERDFAASIARLAKGSNWRGALGLFSSMRRATVPPGLFAYSALIGACNAAGGGPAHWRRSIGLLEEMRQGAVLPGVVAYNASITSCEKCQQWQRAVGLFEDMRLQTVAATTVTFNATISACAPQQWERTFILFGEMQKSSLQLSTVTYNAMISACEKGKKWQWAMHLFSFMCLHSHAPSAVTYGAAVSACEKGSQWERALALLAETALARAPPDTITYSAAISACGKSEQWRRALVLLADMRQNAAKPTAVTCEAAIFACERVDQWQHALALLAEAQKLRLSLSSVGYGAALAACSGGHEWAQMLALLNEMPVHELEPGAVTPALTECEQQGLLDQELAILRRPPPGGAPAAAVGAAVASRLLAAGRRLDAARSLGDSASRAEWNAASRHLWEACGCAITRSLGVGVASGAGTRTQERSTFRRGTSYAKELRLLDHVLQRARPGDAASVCEALEDFGESVLGSSGEWLKLMAGAKAKILLAAAAGAPPGGDVLEVGCYCGYSAIRLALALPHVRIVSLEVDPVHVTVARNLVALAGLWQRVEVCTGHSRRLLPRLPWRGTGGQRQFSVVFMDQRGSRYEEDLALLGKHGLLRPGAVVVADNVLKPGAPLFLWRVAASCVCQTQIARVPEFAMPGAEDWVSVSLPLSSGAAITAATDGNDSKEPPPELAAQLRRLREGSDRMREKAMNRPSVSFEDWATFAEEMRQGLAYAAIRATADAYRP